MLLEQSGNVACQTLHFPDKKLVKKGRGEHVELETKIDGVNISAVKWADSRCVSLVSSFSCAYPLQEVKRHDKKQKKTVTIPCPPTVKIYNQFMGGVDLMDAVIALHRIHTRSKKYYHKLMFHLLAVLVVNSWLLFTVGETRMASVCQIQNRCPCRNLKCQCVRHCC